MMQIRAKPEDGQTYQENKTADGKLEVDGSKAPQIGINKMVIVAPNTYVSSEVLGQATGQDPAKISKGLGIRKARLPSFSQSNVTMAAQAIYDFIKNVSSRVEDSAKFFAEPINAVYYATESNDDFSRPEAVVALDMAGSRLLNEDDKAYRPFVEALRHVELKQVTFACAGAGLSLANAIESIYASYAFGRNESSVIITTDTAVYDSVRAPNAESTQGASATLAWITRDPKLLSVGYRNGYGRFTMPFPDFTKFGNHNPKVYGRFSEIGFVYAAAEAVEDLEKAYSKAGDAEALGRINAFVSHVPFPKQAIYFAGFLYEHELKTYHSDVFSEMQQRPGLGPSPLGNRRFVDLMREKLRAFDGRNNDIVEYIAGNKEINDYWEWLKRLRAQPEFEEFTEALNIDKALVIPAEVGNSYTGSTHIALASELLNGSGTDFVIVYYGSGLITEAYHARLAALSRNDIEENVIVSFGDSDIPLNTVQYSILHDSLLEGDARRTTLIGSTANLIERDRWMLRIDGKQMPRGFYLRRRNEDGTWEGEYSDGASMEEIMPRF